MRGKAAFTDSKLLVWPRHRRYDGSSAGNWVTAPNMSEGVVIAENKLHVLYEAGADTYNGHDGKAADYIIRSVHRGSIPSLPKAKLGSR